MVNEFLPKTLHEALSIRKSHDTLIVAGGTDMLIQNRSTASLPIDFKKDVMYLSQIEGLNQIEETPHFIKIGANVTLTDLLKNALTPPLLKHIILEMASPAIRNTATLVGNIANASPAGDSLIGLYLHSAIVEISSLSSSRQVPIERFILGVRKIALASDQIITHVLIPKSSFDVVQFVKVGGRKADSISKVSFGGLAKLDGEKIVDLRLAFGAVNITVVRNMNLEEQLKGMTLSELSQNIEVIVQKYGELIKPIDDQRSNAKYRLQVSLNLLRSFLMNLVKQEVKR